MAGTDTTAHTLTITTYNILKEPRILMKLQAELREAIPRKDSWVPCAELENLPYLRGVFKESLRWSSVTPGRLPRVVPSTGVVLCGRGVAPGVSAHSFEAHLGLIDCPPQTLVSSAAHVYHHDPNVFSDPECFRPERWLVSDEETSELEKNLMPFSRGSRQCPGQKYVLFCCVLSLYRGILLCITFHYLPCLQHMFGGYGDRLTVYLVTAWRTRRSISHWHTFSADSR